MAVIISIDSNFVTPEQYDKVTAELDLNGNRPKGLLVHAASFDESGAHITDVWESAEDMQAFGANRLGAELAKVGVTALPPMNVREARNVVIY